MIYSYDDIKAGEVVGPVDVCVIGSGAGGSVMAHYLSKAGLKVVVLEKGAHYPSEELGKREVRQLTRIQAMTIFTPVTGEHTRVSLIAGECYGGGTVGSESVTWDFPQIVLEDWNKLGLTSFSPDNPRLEEYRLELRKLLNVHPVEPLHHNPCNQILKIGAEREGIKWKSVERPVSYCMRCGNCTQGCHYGVKNDSANTFLAWAGERGADAYCGASVEKIAINYYGPDDHPYSEKLKFLQGASRTDTLRELENGKKGWPSKFTVTALVTDRKSPPPRKGAPDSRSITVHSDQVALAAGPLGTSRLLLKSKINPNQVVGKRFTTHPTSFNVARFGRSARLNGWDGINDTIEVHHFSDMYRNEDYFNPDRHGFLLEGALSLPWGVSNLLPGTGKEHVALMRDMNHMAGIEVNVKTDSYGRVTEKDVRFDLSERDNEAMLYGTWVAARIFFRAGAREIFTGLPGLVLRSPADLDKIFKYKRGGKKGFMQKQANLYSGHIFGGAVMGVDPKTSFADETGECHHIKGLWVSDGSAFPTNVGVNCCLSIMFAARKIADDFIAKT